MIWKQVLDDEHTKHLKKLYKNGGTSFYCKEAFNSDQKFTSFKSYIPKNSKSKRAYRMEWEHIVAAENFGRAFKEWREGHPNCKNSKGEPFKGRRCARKRNLLFRQMEADPINLVPSIGELNGLRSNYRFKTISSKENQFGTCNIKIENKSAEPPNHVKGDIARTYRYMEQKYKVKIIGKSSRKLFLAWEKLDPLDKEECIRVKKHRIINGMGIYKELCRKL
jgi:deoxyribonuclease I